jgi:hypothetical protein
MRRPIVVLTVTATAFACAGHPSTRASDPTLAPATSVTSAPTTTQDPKAAVLAAYQRFWQVWLEANNPPNPTDPRLAEVDTGAQLERDRAEISRNRAAGITFKKATPSRADHRAFVLRLAGASALLEDCSLDDGVVVSRSSGSVINADVITYLWRVTIVKKGGLWKVADNTRLGKWRGANNCGWGSAGAHSP